jgi:type IV pilus assembly protein PilA
MGTKREEGFSLIELLIVVAGILVIAAIAIPNLIRARISANQASAIASLRGIAESEIQYQSNYSIVGFSATLVTLGTGAATNPPTPCPPAGASSIAACLIDGVLTAASVFPKSGYVISEVGVAGAGGANDSYVSEAGPVTFDRTGTLAYCVINDNVIRQNPANAASGLPGTTPVSCLQPPFVPLN